MSIDGYTAYFHDGAVLDIQHIGDRLIIALSSAEVDPEEMADHILLSNDDKIVGRLHLLGVRNIRVNRCPLQGQLRKIHDRANIFDFSIKDGHLSLSVSWSNYPPKPKMDDFSTIEVDAKEIYWENIPDLRD